MTPTGAFDEVLNEARDALGALMALNSSRVADTIDCISRLSAAEGRIAGFLEAIALTDPPMSAELFPRAESFLAEAIAARAMLGGPPPPF